MKSAPRKSVPRMVRVNELLKREVAELIERRIEKRDDCLISVTKVITTPDLRTAKVFISILGSLETQKEMFKVLIKKRKLIQQSVAKNITLKYTPVIELVYDDRIEAGDKVLEMINNFEDSDNV